MKEGSWDELREREGNRLIDTLTEYAPNFRESLLDWLVYTPADLEQRVFLTDGNIHHTSHIPSQLMGDRLFSPRWLPDSYSRALYVRRGDAPQAARSAARPVTILHMRS